MSIVTPKTNFIDLLEDTIDHLIACGETGKVPLLLNDELITRLSVALVELEDID